MREERDRRRRAVPRHRRIGRARRRQLTAPLRRGRPPIAHLAALYGLNDELIGSLLGQVAGAFDGAGIPYLLIGGMASMEFGRPRRTRDVDVLVRPEHAHRALEALARGGFRTEETDARWLFKAWRQEVLIDVIFNVHGLHLDRDMLDHGVPRPVSGHVVRLISPEDLLLTKAMVHDEESPRHWFDALSLIAADHLDWAYLERRARRAPRRILSLLIYAHSLDLSVPVHVLRSLYEQIYGT
jgi:hypothetical protein